MAFGFIKKVFSFGKKQVEERPAEDEALPPLNLDALEGFRDKAPEKPEHPAVAEPAVEPEATPQPAPPLPQPTAPEPTPEASSEAEPEPAPTPETPSEPEPTPAPEASSEPIAEEPEPTRQEAPAEPEPKAAPKPRVPAEPNHEPQPAPEALSEPIREEPKPAPESPSAPDIPSASEAPSEPASKKSEPAPQEIPPKPEPQPQPVPDVLPEPIPETPQPATDEVPTAPEPPLETPGTAEMPSPASPAPPRKPEGKVSVAKAVERKLEPEKAPELAPAPRQSWFQRMRTGLSRSSRELTGNIAGIFTRRKLDEDTLQDLEDVLIRADLGVETAIRVTDALASGRYGRDISDAEVRGVMATEMEKVLVPVALPLELDLSHKPHVILVVGVNGTGKTTTIGKLAAKLTAGGLSVMLAAGDTFRAAAIEQLKIWGERTHSPVIASKLGADAAGLAYDAFEKAKEAGSDVLIIDTAGRLQNKAELMAELEKIVRVLGKLDPEAPHTVLQTVDATTGQNALNQVEIFRNVAGVNGLVLTKLDGTARGGILVAIAAKHKLPVYFIGVGEQVDDLEPFSAKEFAQAIAGVA
ncbi:MAG: signal recognition particle-docking protein FtsY [Rhizobiaceae bacterium]